MTHVVFDVGQVLIRWEPWLVYREDFASRAEIEGFLDEIGFGPWNVEQDRGRSWDEAVKIKVAEFPQHAALIRKFHSSWHDAVPGPIDDTVEALRALQAAGKPFYGITNFSAEKWGECQERFDFLTLFEDVIVSAHERLVKPDPAIFQLFLSRNGLRAADCLFIDDSPANVTSAASLGFDTILFDDPACVIGRLRTRGLPI
ncbi:MAG: HAD family phosphatase [Pseudomonadota bacterium]